MFGKIIELKDNYIYLENKLGRAETNLIGYHVIFNDSNKNSAAHAKRRSFSLCLFSKIVLRYLRILAIIQQFYIFYFPLFLPSEEPQL